MNRPTINKPQSTSMFKSFLLPLLSVTLLVHSVSGNCEFVGREASPDFCDGYIECPEEGDPWIEDCPPENPFFDAFELECGNDPTACFQPEPEEEIIYEDECPYDPDNVQLFPNEDNCSEYFICSNGILHLFHCRSGQHFNRLMNFCDFPTSAGCDETATDATTTAAANLRQLPDCPIGFNGSLPHPLDCSLFVHCETSGARFIQRCKHLHHFDVVSRRCLFMNAAQCNVPRQ